MAGSFFHLWLAKKACPWFFPRSGEDEYRAFLAGSLGPDMGFFPGGPHAFSQRAHLEYCGDFLRALRQEAQGACEEAFAAGWALHAYVDMAVHPWVEDCTGKRLGQGAGAAQAELWHMRLEWGVDCRLLERQEGRFLWEVTLDFPRRPDGESLLGWVGRRFYGQDADEGGLRRGEAATRKWVRRIPRLLLWGGHTCPAHLQVASWQVFLVRNVVGRVLGEWLEEVRSCKNAAALARPWIPEPAALARALELGEEALARFSSGWQEGFAHLGNPDLYRGNSPKA